MSPGGESRRLKAAGRSVDGPSMRAARVGMAVTGVLLAAVCVLLGVLGATVLFSSDTEGKLAGTFVLAITVALLLVGGTYAGYAFVRSAIRMKATTEPNPERSIRGSVAWVAVVVSFWLLPMPGISLVERIFFCVVVVVLGFVGIARDLEPPRRNRR
jgi:hypothetical protein